MNKPTINHVKKLLLVRIEGDNWSETSLDMHPANKREAQAIIWEDIVTQEAYIKRLQERVAHLRLAIDKV